MLKKLSSIAHIGTLALAMFLASCNSGKIIVLDAITEPELKHSFNLRALKHNVEVPKETLDRFDARLHQKLFKDGILTEGKDIIINYRFLQYDEGSRLARYALPGISGEGSVSIEFIFVKADGKQIGKLHAQGRIGGGMFGGSIDSAIDSAVEAVAEFAKATFK